MFNMPVTFTSCSRAKKIAFKLMLQRDGMQAESQSLYWCRPIFEMDICLRSVPGKLPCLTPPRNLPNIFDSPFISSICMCCCNGATVAPQHLVKTHVYKFRLRSPGPGPPRTTLLNNFDRDSFENDAVQNISSSASYSLFSVQACFLCFLLNIVFTRLKVYSTGFGCGAYAGMSLRDILFDLASSAIVGSPCLARLFLAWCTGELPSISIRASGSVLSISLKTLPIIAPSLKSQWMTQLQLMHHVSMREMVRLLGCKITTLCPRRAYPGEDSA